MPSNQAAWKADVKATTLEVKEAPYNSPDENEIVIKTCAVAINPVDSHMLEEGLFIEHYPSIFGCDIAGIVEEVGGRVKTFKKGDRVIA